MLRIYAKLNTDEKVVLNVGKGENQYTMQLLEEKFGGSWVAVDKVENLEVLKFNDGFIYKGFDGIRDRYCNGIVNMFP